jgi:hypothetical protein
MDTGKKFLYCLDVPFSDWQLPNVKGSFRHKADITNFTKP